MDQNMKKKAGLAIFLVFALAVLLYLFVKPISAETPYDTVKTTILKVGKADAIIVEAPFQTMVIDCGEEEDGAEVVQFLQNRGIEKVDVLVITHYDKDHVGGADTLIEQIAVGRVLVPDYDGTSTEYLDFVAAMDTAGITPERLRDPVIFSIGDARVSVEPPLTYELLERASSDATLEVDNDLSLITTLTHGDVRMVFTGDAEKIRLREWLSTDGAQPCDFLKVPHHGVFNSEMTHLAEVLKPEVAAICTSKKNPADLSTVEAFKAQGTTVMETKDGNITVISNGRRIEVSQK